MADDDLMSLRGEVAQLRQQIESREQSWRKLGRLAAGIAIFFCVMALGFTAASVWLDARHYPAAHRYASEMSVVFLLVALPLSLLAQALRGPKRPPAAAA